MWKWFTRWKGVDNRLYRAKKEKVVDVIAKWRENSSEEEILETDDRRSLQQQRTPRRRPRKRLQLDNLTLTFPSPSQYGGSPIKIGDDEYSLFRDAEYVSSLSSPPRRNLPVLTNTCSILAKINE